MSVSSTGAALCAVRTAWRPWTCTPARPLRALTGWLPHDPRGSHHPPSLLQGLHWICKDTGPLVTLRRHVTFVSTEVSPPSLRTPGLGPHAAHRACLPSPLPAFWGTSLPGCGGLLEGKGCGPMSLSLLT